MLPPSLYGVFETRCRSIVAFTCAFYAASCILFGVSEQFVERLVAEYGPMYEPAVAAYAGLGAICLLMVIVLAVNAGVLLMENHARAAAISVGTFVVAFVPLAYIGLSYLHVTLNALFPTTLSSGR